MLLEPMPQRAPAERKPPWSFDQPAHDVRDLQSRTDAGYPRLVPQTGHSFGAPANTELGENFMDMVFDRRFAQAELPCNLFVRKAASKQPQHLAFTPGQGLVLSFISYLTTARAKFP